MPLHNLVCPARCRLLFTLAVLLTSFWTQDLVAQPLSGQQVLNTTVYSDGLAAGWDDWSWNTTRSLDASSPVHSGAASISARFDAAWAGLYLHADPPISLGDATHLRFWLHGGTDGKQQFAVRANAGDSAVTIAAAANRWTEHSIPLADLGSPTTLGDLFWQDATGAAQPVFYLDDIALLGTTDPPEPVEIALTVDVAAQRRLISPYIYGMNFAPEELAAELDLPINRWGGNATSRYNYQTDISNHASDWYFENIKESDSSITPDDSAANRFVEQNRRTGTQTLLTLPMTGWVANGSVHACGFSVGKYGPQQSVEPWRNQCGNGVRPDGSRITGNDPSDTSGAAPPSFTAGWVSYLKTKYGAADANGVRFYNLDNEPDIWFETHRDVRPIGWKYREFRDATIAYAAAAKAADPSAKLLGPVVMGWTYYWYGAYDGQREDWSSPDDRLDNGDMPFVPWYLQQMRQVEEANGVRLLDYLDLHYYPQASGVSLSPAGSATTQALRLRSTRSLWDPGYVDESWIRDAGPDGGIVKLIPRMRAWVEEYYPGTELAITEYNWGALDHINGALAQADVLGIFGREGLDLATLWGPPEADQPGAFAFRLYRNYDGAGGRFGGTSVKASSSDEARLAIYAAERSSDRALTVIVINKATTPLTATLTIANASLSGHAAVYRYSPSNLAQIVREGSLELDTEGTDTVFPAQSVTLLVAPTKAPVEFKNHLYLPAVAD